MKKLILLALLPFILLSGCETQKTEVTQTVDWYMSHDTERAEMLSKCRNNPGELKEDPNCINAMNANRMKATETKKSFKF